MEKTTRRRSRLWIIPLILLILIFAVAAALSFRVGMSVIRRKTDIRQYSIGCGIYLSVQDLTGSQLAGDPLLSGGNQISDPAVTELVTSGGVETLTGGVLPITYFCQGDEQWAGESFGTDTIGPYGCGPTAMAMAVSSITGKTVNPQEMAQRTVELGCWAKGSGSYHSIVDVLSEDFGLRSESFAGRSADELVNELIAGKLFVALMGPGHFTNGGHFILLRGVTLSGEILVADPNSRERSLTAWDPELILGELAAASDNGAPLWALH